MLFVLAVAVDFFGWNDDGGGYFVVGFEVEQAYALCGAAGGTDRFGVDADDLAELADDHQFASLVQPAGSRRIFPTFGVAFRLLTP